MSESASKVFDLAHDYRPRGDQPQAIQSLLEAFRLGRKEQVLLGVTGSGKTFSVANVIAGLKKKVLVLAPNKTLAAQLYSEFKEFFPSNAVEYFVSYYDYYQPEAYIPGSDTYIEKDATINDEIDRLRHSATSSLLDREDVIVVSSVSCIYGIGSPDEYYGQRLDLFVGMKIVRDDLLKSLVAIQYSRNDVDFSRGHFRVRGDIVEVFAPFQDSEAYRLEFFDDEIERIDVIDPLRQVVLRTLSRATFYPYSHYVVSQERLKEAISTIKIELRERLQELHQEGKELEAKRLENRTMLDLEMLEELGFCQGIENYSRHLTGAKAGEPPPTLVDYFDRDFLLVVDESHITMPQIRGMYNGDRARKENLVNYGFRLPSALDNRPLKFEEFLERLDQVLYVSATPADFELERVEGEIVEQIIRPTGLLDPVIEVRGADRQVEDFLLEAKKTIAQGFRVLITTLTKKMAEELSGYYRNMGIRVRYLHSDIDTLERMEILRDLRLGNFDVLVGINLLREGLDLPEVALVAIMDADKEGFLRSERSLIQTIGRAARNEHGRVILYAYKVTPSMERAIVTTRERRERQERYNLEHNISPATVTTKIKTGVIEVLRGHKERSKALHFEGQDFLGTREELEKKIIELENKMKAHAKELNFELAAKYRDEIKALKEVWRIT